MISEPWRRPEPFDIPQDITHDVLHDLGAEDFALLIRANLLPTPQNRSAWKALWAAIAADQDLTDTTGDLLESWQDACTAAAPIADEMTAKRIAKLQHTLLASMDRIDQPLAWAGRSALRFNRASRRWLDELVNDIVTHREAVTRSTPADTALWSALEDLALDSHGDPDAQAVQRGRALRTAKVSTAEDDPPVRVQWRKKADLKFNWAGRRAIQELAGSVIRHRRELDEIRPCDDVLWSKFTAQANAIGLTWE